MPAIVSQPSDPSVWAILWILNVRKPAEESASGVISAATRTFAVVRDDARQLRTFVVDRTLHSRMNAILPAYEAALPAALPTSASGGRHD